MTPEIESSLRLFRVMLFGDDRFEDLKPESKGIGDTAKVLVHSLELGLTLKNLDPKEELFHIELFPSFKPEPKCEIWLTFEWKESNARYNSRKEYAIKDRAFREKNKERLDSISTKLKSFGFSQPGFAEHLAKEILVNWRSGNYADMLKTLSIADTLASFDEEDKQDTTTQ